MLIPTTTVTVVRSIASSDPYEEPTITIVLDTQSAHVSGVSGVGQNVGGAGEVIDAQLLLESEAGPIARGDRVTDDVTGEIYTVRWSRVRIGLGLDYQKCGLVSTKGAANG